MVSREGIMPTYQYVCATCNAPLEVVQSFSDDALVECPECKAPELRKVYGSVGVVFKGSGFYRTDSRGAATATSVPSSPESGSATKSENTTSTSAATESAKSAPPA
jgi:putative FmdB family regulatory protein